MELLLNEQDVVDSVCVYAAYRDNSSPQDVDADLQFNQQYGFSASSQIQGHMQRYFNEQEVVDAVSEYLQEYHNFPAERILVELRFSQDEGIHASVKITNDY